MVLILVKNLTNGKISENEGRRRHVTVEGDEKRNYRGIARMDQLSLNISLRMNLEKHEVMWIREYSVNLCVAVE